MELPKLRKQDLSEELREIVGDNDIEFEPLVDPMDILTASYDEDTFMEKKAGFAKLLVESRRKQHEYQMKARKESEQA